MSLIINDAIFLRRPTLNYVCPPVCENIFSSTGFPIIVLNPVPHHGAPTGVRVVMTDEGFELTWDAYPGAICYNIYKALNPDDDNSAYEITQECIPGIVTPVDAGCYRVSAITLDGESDLSAPACTSAKPPTVETDAATDLEENSARLHGTANPKGTETSVHFEWGIDTSYGNTTPPQSIGPGANPVAFLANISGIDFGTTYHFRAVASNIGGTVFGADETFTTPGPPKQNLKARWESTSVVANDGDRVPTWADTSLGVGDATNVVVNQQPIYKTNIFGTLPGLLFASGSATQLFFTAIALPKFTVFVAWETTTIAAFGGPLGWRAGGIAGFSLTSNDAGDFKPHITITDASNTPTQGLTTTEPGTNARGKAIDVWRFDGSNVSGSKNGVDVITGPGNATADLDGQSSIGGSWFGNSFDGHMAAVLVYDSDSVDEGDVLAYLNGKYGIY